MGCEGMETEKAFLSALAQPETWKIEGDKLELCDDAGKTVAQFEARAMK